MARQWLSFLQALLLSFAGGGVFYLLDLPLPWLLGTLAAVSAAQVWLGREFYMPSWLYTGVLLLLGYTLGSSFTREAALQIVDHFPFMAAGTILTMAVSLLLGLWVSRKSDLDVESVILGSVPGGLSQMLVISDQLPWVNQTVVLFLQVIRVLAVVLIVPFLTVYGIGADHGNGTASLLVSEGGGMDFSFLVYVFGAILGYPIGRKLRLPNSVLTGPLIMTALISIISGNHVPVLPDGIMAGLQMIMGISLARKVNPEMLGNLRRFGAASVGSSLGLVLFSFVMAYLFTLVTPMTMTTAFLGLAPGGIAEMGMTAASVGADLPLVSAYQLFRLLFILFLVVPLIQKWTGARQKAREVNAGKQKNGGR